MKRLLRYIALLAILLPLLVSKTQGTITPQNQSIKLASQTTIQIKKPTNLPVAVASVVSSTPVFNPSDSSTWPSCPAGDIVWASNGTCHVPAVQSDPSPPSVAQNVNTVIDGCGDNSYANFIFEAESSCNLAAENYSSNECGIGQTNCEALISACPDWTTDYICQDSWFNNYAINRYGSWEAAYNFHIANGWW